MTHAADEIAAFFQAYFHEDWNLDDAEPRDVVERFARETRDTTILEALVASLDRVLAEVGDRDIERRLFAEYGCYYNPRSDGLSARGFLAAIAAQLHSIIRNRRA